MNIEKNFTKGRPIPHRALDTSVERLINKCKFLKHEWSKIIVRIKNGTGLSPEKEPVRFKHLDPIFIETNGEMKLSSSAAETAFLNEQDKEHEEKQNDEEDIFCEADKIDETTSWKVK